MTLGTLKNNQPIFYAIDALIKNIQSKIGVSNHEKTTVSEQFPQLKEAINQLKICQFSSTKTSLCAKSARLYINKHFDSKTRSLSLSEMSGSQEKRPSLSN